MKFNNCGTYAGYQKHYRAKDKPCDACSAANVEHYREYRKKRGEELRAKRRMRYKINPEKIKQSAYCWREKNPEKVAAWRINNAEYDKQRKKLWAKNNPEKVQIKHNRRRARLLNNKYEKYTIKQVLDLYGSLCHICGIAIDLKASRRVGIGDNWQNSLHIDHVIPIARGGGDILENVRPSHAICNMKKGAR